MPKKISIGVAMIVKNESEMLSRALDSIKGVDLLTIVDTGSEDNTVEIAHKYTDDVHFFQWVDHFGKARQYSKDKSKADWIITLDADEFLDTPLKHVREVVEQADKQGFVFVNVHVAAEGGVGENLFPRIYKNIPEVTWHGAAHNYLNYKGEMVGKSYNSDIRIIYGYSPAHKKDPERTLRILKKAVDADPELRRERFYLAREYFYRHNWEKAIEHLDEYIKRSNFIGERNDAWLMRAYCLAGLQKYNEACDSAWQALKYNANFKEALLFIANHMDPVNKERWLSFAELADNRNVLFVRSTENANQ
jgi:glycosyltransferase involved in cell wall biosynthesis